MFNFIESLLDDEYGIDQDAWDNLMLVVRGLSEGEEKNKILDMLDKVDAVDGRYFLP
jgi:hypothetical protein